MIGNSAPALVWNPQTKLLSPFNYTVPTSNPYNTTGAATPLTYVSEHGRAKTWPTTGGRRPASKWSFTLPYGDWDRDVGQPFAEHGVERVHEPAERERAEQHLPERHAEFREPAATPNAFNGLFREANNLGISKLDTIDATLSTPNLFHLPAGDVGIGFGARSSRTRAKR